MKEGKEANSVFWNNRWNDLLHTFSVYEAPLKLKECKEYKGSHIIWSLCLIHSHLVARGASKSKKLTYQVLITSET